MRGHRASRPQATECVRLPTEDAPTCSRSSTSDRQASAHQARPGLHRDGGVLVRPRTCHPSRPRRAQDHLRTDVYRWGHSLRNVSGQLPHPDSPNAVLYHISTQPAASLAPWCRPAWTLDRYGAGALASDPALVPSRRRRSPPGGSIRQARVWPAPPSLPATPSSSSELSWQLRFRRPPLRPRRALPSDSCRRSHRYRPGRGFTMLTRCCI